MTCTNKAIVYNSNEIDTQFANSPFTIQLNMHKNNVLVGFSGGQCKSNNAKEMLNQANTTSGRPRCHVMEQKLYISSPNNQMKQVSLKPG